MGRGALESQVDTHEVDCTQTSLGPKPLQTGTTVDETQLLGKPVEDKVGSGPAGVVGVVAGFPPEAEDLDVDVDGRLVGSVKKDGCPVRSTGGVHQ